MKNEFNEWQQEFEKHWQETFSEPYVPKKMTEEEKQEAEAMFLKTFNYDPDEEEVDARYDKEFNDWCNNL